jgi:hypothetical protein
MAPKRSELKGKKKEAQPPTGEWTYSKCSRQDLDRLVSEGLLQDKNLVNRHPSFHEPFPMENVDEIVTFYHFVKRGLALPSCSFFRGLLYYYRLKLHHLNPNSICHISIFIYFYEALLGMEPHWDLFRFLFHVKPQPTSKNLSVVGGTGIQLCQQAGDKYLSYKFPSNLPGWKNHWFYIENHAPQLLAKSNNPPVVRLEWNLKLSRGDMDQVEELLVIIEAQKMMGVTGASVMFSFFKRRVQPIQQRHRLGFEYTGSADLSRMCAEELSNQAALLRVQRVLLDVDAVPYVPKLFSARNLPKPVSIRLLFVEDDLCSTAANWKPSAGIHRTIPQLPAAARHPQPDHLLPSAAVEAKRARIAQALHSSDSTKDESPLVEKEAEGEARRDNSSEPAMELTKTLPLVSQGRRLVRKRKAEAIESSGY